MLAERVEALPCTLGEQKVRVAVGEIAREAIKVTREAVERFFDWYDEVTPKEIARDRRLLRQP